MTSYRRIEINAFRRRFTVVCGEQPRNNFNLRGEEYHEDNEDTSRIYSMGRRSPGGHAPEASAPYYKYGGTSSCAADCECGCRDRLEHDRSTPCLLSELTTAKPVTWQWCRRQCSTR